GVGGAAEIEKELVEFSQLAAGQIKILGGLCLFSRPTTQPEDDEDVKKNDGHIDDVKTPNGHIHLRL
ncbi:MAG: hypothetical protein KKD59_00755, partial [Acidobacteria bacterium]|nr:hypothetical protein [Acidobacteriota bacterium]